MSETRRDGGGTAMASGARFEVLVGAWLLVYVLAEAEAPWMPAGCRVRHVRGNTGQPVDDYLVATEGNLGLGWSFIQVKRSMNHSDAPESQYAGLIDQFVKQYWSWKQGTADRNWERPLEVGRDALLLAIGSGASSTITSTLAAVLNRAAAWPEGEELDQVPRNDDETSVWSAFKAHVGRTWTAAAGFPPGRQELQELAGLTTVKPLLLEGEGGSLEACHQLLTQALANPSQVEEAWSLLYNRATRLSADSAGYDRKTIIRELAGAGIPLRGKPSFEPQRQQLRRISARAMEDLQRFANINVPGEVKAVRVDRPVSRAAKGMADSRKHFLITGEPGAGKSGVLAGLAKELTDSGETVLLLSADTAAFELQQLGDSAVEVILDWAAASRGWLLIDAIDAVREPSAAAGLKRLIHQVVSNNGDWTVIATCRVFDLRHGGDLQRLFRGDSHATYRSEEFRRTRHLHVERLTADEIEQVKDKSPTLRRYLSAATEALREVLSVPFHLWLLADLTEVIEPAALAGIEGKFALMREYWLHRVAFGVQRDAREAVLRAVCDDMVAGHQMYCDRLVAASAGASTLADLQHDEVLVPRQGPDDYTWLKFPHHALYDFAVARLVLGPRMGDISSWLAQDRTRALSVRPSFVLVAEEAWANPTRFWSITAELSAEQIPAVLRLIPAEVLASRVNSLGDLSPLVTMLNHGDPEVRRTGARLLDGARTALQTKTEPIPRPWLEGAMACATAALTRETLGEIESLAWHSFRRHPGANSDLVHAITVATLSFALDKNIRSSTLLRRSIDVLAGTIPGQDPAPAQAVLEQLLDPARLASFGYMYVSNLGQAMKAPMFDQLPDVVEATYSQVFKVEPAEDGPVPMGRLPAMHSNMRQDYQMGRWALGKNAKAFAMSRPLHATRAMLAVLWGYATTRHRVDALSEPTQFEVQGRAFQLLEDSSYFWDSGTYSHDDSMVVLQGWEDALHDALNNGEQGHWVEAVDYFVEHNRLAIGWSRILRILREHPAAFHGLAAHLCTTPALLTCESTHTEAGKTLEALHSASAVVERARLEQIVLDLPNATEDESERPRLKKAREWIIASLRSDLLVTQEAKGLRAGLKGDGTRQGLKPLFSIGPVMSTAFTWRDDLEEKGVDLSVEPGAVAALESVEKFQAAHGSQAPLKSEVEEGLAACRLLHQEIQGGQLNPSLLGSAQGYLAEACAILADSEHLDELEGAVDFVEGVLLAAASTPRPAPAPDRETEFAQLPSWGMPNASVSAARGLLPLVERTGPTPARLAAIKSLSTDPEPAVRFQLAQSANVLYNVARDEMWSLLERILLVESNSAVVLVAIAGPMRRLLRHHEDRCINLLIGAWGRSADWGQDDLDEALGRPLLEVLLYWDRKGAADALESWISTPWTRPGAFHALVSSTLDAVRSPQEGNRRPAAEVQESAMSLLRLATANLSVHAQSLPWSAPEPKAEALEEMRLVARLLESVASSIRFFVDSPRRDTPKVDDATLRWFAGRVRPLVESLMVLPAVSIAHHLVEMFSALADHEPREVFLLMNFVVCRSSDQDNYYREALAADEVVKLVQRYLADHGEVFKDHDCKLALVDVLDQFAGWPQAQPLLHQLDELFR